MRYHYLPDDVISGIHGMKIIVIGAGGTGSHFIKQLARLNMALKGLGRPGLNVVVYDDDIIDKNTPLRTIYSPYSEQKYKAIEVVEMVNQFYDCNFKFEKEYYIGESIISYQSTIFATCVDSISSRKAIYQSIRKIKSSRGIYWMDFGNEDYFGQVVLGSIGKVDQPEPGKGNKNLKKLKCVTDIYPGYLDGEDDNADSCSVADAISNQGLYTNEAIAMLGAEILKEFLLNYRITQHGAVLNLQNFSLNPIMV